MRKIKMLLLIFFLSVAVVGCGNKTDVSIVDTNWTVSENSYGEGYEVKMFAELKNSGDKDLYNSHLLNVQFLDDDGDIFFDKKYYTGFIFAGNNSFVDYFDSVDKKPKEVKFEIVEMEEEDRVAENYKEYQSSRNNKLTNIFTIKNDEIKRVNNYYGMSGTHYEYVGEIVNEGKYNFAQFEYPFALGVQAVFYKNGKIVEIKTDYTDSLVSLFEENHVETFNVNLASVDFQDSSKYDEIKLVPMLYSFI